MKMHTLYLLPVLTLISCNTTRTNSTLQEEYNLTATEQEIHKFMDSYAEDLRQHRREAIANRYDPRGYYRMGNGSKTLRSFEETKTHYLTRWTGPKSFEWKDLSIEVLSPHAAFVTALFDWERNSGEKQTISYTGVLAKQSGEWRIRVEDESISPLGYTIQTISGSSSIAGPYKYTLKALPGASIAAHRHSVDMKITVRSGRKPILMGNLDIAKIQVFEEGSSFVIPANTWHVEWWETETVEEIEIVAPMRTERSTPTTPRTSYQSSRFSKGAYDSAQVDITQLTAEWNKAIINRDSVTLNKILASEFSLNGSTLRSGWMNNTLHHFTTDSAEFLGPLNITFYGQAARSEGILYWKASWDGKPRVNTEFLITDIWVKRNGRWQVLLRMSDIIRNR